MKIEFVGKCLFMEIGGQRILVVGDLHLGYEESLNRTGVFVSRKLYEEMIAEFDSVFEKIGSVDMVVLLGDVKHVIGSVLGQEWKDVLKLFDYFLERADEVVIVKGNHDVILEPIVRKNPKVKLVESFVVDEIGFAHGDKKILEFDDLKVWVLGHGHPAVKISDGVKVEKFKCFLVGSWKRKKVILVPSFFSANVGSDPRENLLSYGWDFDLENFDVRVVSSEGLDVLDFGKLSKLN